MATFVPPGYARRLAYAVRGGANRRCRYQLSACFHDPGAGNLFSYAKRHQGGASGPGEHDGRQKNRYADLISGAAYSGGDVSSISPMIRRRQSAEKPREARNRNRSEGHTSELQSLMRISYAVFCLKKKTH